MNFTSEQTEAISTHDCNLIVTAGAGSGKTRVLVERFIALLDAHPEWPLTSIVAVTFTEKAAREMRDRVRSAIERRLRGASGAARDQWFERYAALNGARIGTIHGLCAQLLRANPAEARLDPAFEVLDEHEAATVLEDAVEEALARLAGSGSPAADLLRDYDLRDVRSVLRAYAGPGAAADVARTLAASPDALRARWQAAWHDRRREIIAALRDDTDWQAALAWIGPDDLDDLPAGDKLADIWAQVLAAAPALSSADDSAFCTEAGGLAAQIDLRGGSKAKWGGDERLAECKAALETIRALLRQALKDIGAPPGALDDAAAAWVMRWGEAIALAAGEYRRRKAARSALDFADLEHEARRLLRSDTVCARYQAEFHHVLVDEFQDTNAAQRDIVTRLCAADRPEGAGRLFAVGDPKQSIYAFRGADVTVFGAVRRDVLAHGGRELPLSVSFRAHDRLVAAFNDLFGAILSVGAGPAAPYEVTLGKPMSAHRVGDPAAHPRHAEPITVIAIPTPDKATEPEYQDKEALRRWEAWELAQAIKSMVVSGAAVWDRAQAGGGYRPATFGDAAVLFQTMNNAPLVEEVFKAVGVPYVTIAGRGYFDRQEVWDLLNLLRALHDPYDDLALAAALRSPLFGLSDEALLALRLPPDGAHAPVPLWQAMRGDDPADFPAEDTAALDFARAVLGELRDRAGRVSNADLLARALSLTGYLAALSGLPDGARRRGNVEKLLRLAQASGRVGLGAFNAYARDLTVREVREGEAALEVENAVTLMTVHASKGLEFPIVALFDTTWSRADHGAPFALDPDAGPVCDPPRETPDDDAKPFAVLWAKSLSARREQAERRRLLYVAATRAADHLILSGTLKAARIDSWLVQWLRALGVDHRTLAPGAEPLRVAREWGNCVICVPAAPPHPASLLPGRDDGASGWDHPALQSRTIAVEAPIQRPPLLAPVPAEPEAPARTLSATQIARLGRAPFTDPQASGLRAFRHAVLHDAPEALPPLPAVAAAPAREPIIVGQTVHRALRAWLLPGVVEPALLDQRLRTYAWEQGVSSAASVQAVVDQAQALLARFAQSRVRRELESAQQVYRELPFVVHVAGGRAIHGVLDVLYFDGRTWHVLDYKTALVSVPGAKENARRHFLQVGVYAAAVHAQTGQVPRTSLYYIHPCWLVEVRPEDWQPALARLDDDVRAALALEPEHTRAPRPEAGQ